MNPARALAPTLNSAEQTVAMNPAPAERASGFLDDVAAGRVVLPKVPPVVQRLVAALREPEVDARQISQALFKDKELSAKVLRLASSSFFGAQRAVASIDAAIAVVGTQGLNRLIIACGVSSIFEGLPGIDLRTFWRNALVAAAAASKLAPRLQAEAEEAYVCALLHATGHLILCRTYPETAKNMFRRFESAWGAELAAMEQGCFGISHPSVGALWVEDIGFPQAIADAIRHATKPLADSDGPLDQTLRSACALAAAVARDDDADAAYDGLHPKVRAQFTGAEGKPNAIFRRLYDGLMENQPTV